MDTHNAVISIIVPIYNVESYLERCLTSLINQSYKNIQIILIDDCSLDNSSKIARDFAQSYPALFKYHKHDRNSGLAAARNTGIKISNGDYLSFVDSDDWVDKDFIKQLVETAQNDDSDIVICDYNYAWDDKIKCQNSVKGIFTKSSQKKKVALLRNHSVTRLYKRSFFMSCNLKFPEFIKRGEDMGVTIPMLTMTSKISLVDIPLYNYYQRESSISNKNSSEIDLSFYKSAFDLVLENSNNGFEIELEYRAIQEIMYGLNMLIVKSKKKKSYLIENINQFNKQYPNWMDNKYLIYCNKAKLIFIKLAARKQFILLKLLVLIREKTK